MNHESWSNLVTLMVVVLCLILGSIATAVLFLVSNYLGLRWREWRSRRHHAS